MSAISVLYNRIFYRHRYVEDSGWVVSRDSFKARAQPKFNDSTQRTRAPDTTDAFLNTIVFRDAENPIAGYVTSSFKLPSIAEAVINAQSGTELVVGDRLFEEDSTYILIVRGNSQFRDGFGIKHDEVICSEASQLDQRWITSIKIGGSPLDTGEIFDSLRNQYTRITRDDVNLVNAFGVIESGAGKNTNEVERTEVGKEINDTAVVNIDADFNVTENNTLHFYGKDWKINWIRETLSRVKIIGVESYKARGMTGDVAQEQISRRIDI